VPGFYMSNEINLPIDDGLMTNVRDIIKRKLSNVSPSWSDSADRKEIIHNQVEKFKTETLKSSNLYQILWELQMTHKGASVSEGSTLQKLGDELKSALEEIKILLQGRFNEANANFRKNPTQENYNSLNITLVVLGTTELLQSNMVEKSDPAQAKILKETAINNIRYAMGDTKELGRKEVNVKGLAAVGAAWFPLCKLSEEEVKATPSFLAGS